MSFDTSQSLPWLPLDLAKPLSGGQKGLRSGLNPTKNGEFTNLFQDPLLPFLEHCFPCGVIGNIGEFHLLPSHGCNHKECNKKLESFCIICLYIMGLIKSYLTCLD